ncbi:Acetyltransferase (GNAT) family protein [compost metagenome]
MLSFLDTAYYDNVLKEKEHYDNPSIELVALESDEVIGFIDIELDTPSGRVCSNRSGVGGMIWHLGVHPDYRKMGIGRALLNEAITMVKAQRIENYLQVYMEGGLTMKGPLHCRMGNRGFITGVQIIVD